LIHWGIVRPMRVRLMRQLVGSTTLWRLTESDGELVDRWLPNEGPGESLDAGGFESYADAAGFALAIDWVRAQAGLLGDLTIADVDREHAKLDEDRRGRHRRRFPNCLGTRQRDGV
jgi:hypothetical protein